MNSTFQSISFWSLILTVAALIIATWQVYQANKQKKETKEQLNELQRIRQNMAKIETSMSTNYLSLFPNYNHKIANLINGAKDQIEMFYDIPAYGAMSNPRGWLEIKQALERKISEGVRINVYLYNDRLRKEVFREQFKNSNAEFDKWIRSESNTQKLKSFFQNMGTSNFNDTSEMDLDRYVDLSLEIQRAQQDVFKGVNVVVKEVNNLMPIYFWSRDNTESIFAIPAFDENASELGFQTFDRNILDALSGLKRRYESRI